MGLFGNMFGFDGGGIGNSGPSTSETTTETNDMRVVGAEGSVNTSSKIDLSGTGNTLTTTDHGAQAIGLQLAMRGIEAVSAQSQAVQAGHSGLLDGVMKSTRESSAQFATALENVKTSDVRILLFTSVAAVAIVAVMAFKKG